MAPISSLPFSSIYIDIQKGKNKHNHPIPPSPGRFSKKDHFERALSRERLAIDSIPFRLVHHRSIDPSNRVDHRLRDSIPWRIGGLEGVEKARLLSLALDFGFDQQSATKCLDRLVSLYGDEDREFITVEHCGDDFLAELAETMQDTEDWDDLQAAKSEACGVLADMFGQHIPYDGGGCNVVHNVTIIEDSPQPEKNQTFLEVDSSTDSEDEDDIFGSKMGRKSTGYSPNLSKVLRGFHPLNFWARRSLESMVCF
ncbi:hypothetical protein NL676_030480 [Syzygium grande]|nr:hypothetical protein NL676_030480 [Syzygium grande]